MCNLGWAVLCAVGVLSFAGVCAAAELLPEAEVEEGIYTYEPANNGSGPLWCYGSTCLVRVGQDVFAGGIETLPGVKPLNNVRWLLFKRTAKGWELQQSDPKGRTREGCPLAGFPDGRLFISANPTLTETDTYNGPASPQVLEFKASNPQAPFVPLQPAWEGKPPFTEHSYRGFCADGPGRELLLFNILGHEAQHWSFRDRDGKWSAFGKMVFPMGADYEVPEPIRLCYPVLALKNRAAHVIAISDIIEPVKAWREYKLVLHGGKSWDYDFRRLFYAWTPDITKEGFRAPIEVASREKTAGHITNLDIWIDKGGRAHLLWLERSVWEPKMREKFFPEVKITTSLEHGVVDRGKVVERTTLAVGGEGASSEIPGYGRLHATPDGRLFAFYYCSGADDKGRPVAENRLVEILPGGKHGEPVRVPLAHPFNAFMTASERGGSPPSNTLDVLGQADGRPGISYARISLFTPLRADLAWSLRREAAGTRLSLDASASRASAGKVVSWEWRLGTQAAAGPKAELLLARGGPLQVALTVKDDRGNRRTATRALAIPVGPADLGLKEWPLPLRTEAEGFAAEGGGTIHVRTDKLAASALSLSHWNTKGHWLEWEVESPWDEECFLVARYATPEDAGRVITLNGQAIGTMRFASTGGYGSETQDHWSLALLRGPDGKPLPVRLARGTHRVRLENADGAGLNLDILDWVPRKSLPAPEGFRVIEGESGKAALPPSGVIHPSRMNPENGFCYTVPLGSHYPGDGIKDGPASTLRLFEDGKELGPAHAPHVEIREKGQGRHSHWNTQLYLSASDNTDPRTNGRRYTWKLAK